MWRYPGNATIQKHKTRPSTGNKRRRDDEQIMTNKRQIWNENCTNKYRLQKCLHWAHFDYLENRMLTPLKPLLRWGGANVTSKPTLLHIKRLNKTESPIFIILCVLCFQRQLCIFIFILPTFYTSMRQEFVHGLMKASKNALPSKSFSPTYTLSIVSNNTKFSEYLEFRYARRI